MNGRTALSLGERVEVEAALGSAFEELRRRRSRISPLRVRAAVRWGRGAEPPPPAALRWSSAIRRISEMSVAVGMSVMMFGAALGPAQPERRDNEWPVMAATSVRSAGPSIEEQVEIKATKDEWLGTLRARLDAFVSSQLQDMLDPTVVRPIPRVRTDLSEPRGTGRTEPY